MDPARYKQGKRRHGIHRVRVGIFATDQLASFFPQLPKLIGVA
jgi:hypothetical protein